MKLKFHILALVLISSLQVHAQNAITITGSCSDSEVLGTYNYIGDINGKASYSKEGLEVSCDDFTTQISCDTPKRYNVSWDGSKWEWFIDVNYLGFSCFWFTPAAQCINNVGTPNPPSTILLATSTDDTTLPPSNGWVAEPNGCIPNITQTLSTIQNTFSNDLVLYPNPTNGNITINFGKTNGSLSISLMNLIGQVIWTKYFHNSSLIQFKIDQPSGMYFVKITGEKGERAHLKVLKK